MQRDWKLIRNILTYIGDDRIQHLDPDDIAIYKHCQLLKDAGYLNFDRRRTIDSETPIYICGWLTWKGHDLLEYIGNGIAIEELEEYGHPITEYTLKKYAEFMLEKELFEEGEEVVD